MIFIVRRPQYFISHTKSQRLLVTRLRLSCEKVNLDNTNNHNTHNQALSSISRFYALLLDLTDFSNPPQRLKISAPSLSPPPRQHLHTSFSISNERSLIHVLCIQILAKITEEQS